MADDACCWWSHSTGDSSDSHSGQKIKIINELNTYIPADAQGNANAVIYIIILFSSLYTYVMRWGWYDVNMCHMETEKKKIMHQLGHELQWMSYTLLEIKVQLRTFFVPPAAPSVRKGSLYNQEHQKVLHRTKKGSKHPLQNLFWGFYGSFWNL